MPKIEKCFSFDAEGDTCVYVRILDDDGAFIRYASEQELRQMFCPPYGRVEPEPVPDACGICLTCGGECEDGACPNTCVECDAHYPQGGDGYDGRCPSCADQAEARR